MKKFILVILLLLSVLLSSCGRTETLTLFSMDTILTISASSDDLFSSVLNPSEIRNRLDSLENLFSATIEDSDVSRFNQSESGCAVSVKTACIVSDALTLRERFPFYDITIRPLTALWNISHADEDWCVPSPADIQTALSGVGGKITVENPALSDDSVSADCSAFLEKYDSRTAIDLGSIGKGWAVGEIASLLKENDVTGTISFGGNVAAVGTREFRIGVRNPFDTSDIIGTLTVGEGIIAVSGSYERYAEYDGNRYHHILNPSTGYPAESDVVSALVYLPGITPKDGALADALSTVCFMLGTDSLSVADEYPIEILLITADGEILMTDGLNGRFEKK